MKAHLENIQVSIDFATSSTRNVLDCTEDMDGNTSDQFEEDLFESIQNETVGIEQKIQENKRTLSEILASISELKRSLELGQIPHLQEQQEKLVEKLELEKEAIEGKIKIVIKNAYKKACKRDEELE